MLGLRQILVAYRPWIKNCQKKLMIRPWENFQYLNQDPIYFRRLAFQVAYVSYRKSLASDIINATRQNRSLAVVFSEIFQ